MADWITLNWASKGLSYDVFNMEELPTSMKLTISGTEYTVTDESITEIWDDICNAVDKVKSLTVHGDGLSKLLTAIVARYLS